MTPPNERLRELRLAANLTQLRMADAINKPFDLSYFRQTISMIESGKREPPARVISEWCTLTGHPEEAPGICAQYGKVHPVTAHALRDPDFATLVHKLAKEHTATH